MKLAIASEQDFKRLWKIQHHMIALEYECDESKIERRQAAILGNLDRLGSGGLTRVVMGCQTLISNCCDKELDYYEFSPRLKKALALLEKVENQQAAVLPIELTAENGAKYLLSHEFFESVEMECPNPCCDPHCDICDGNGYYTMQQAVEWKTIKAIYAKIVENIADQS
tara:strand:- start:319 stop:825 length:507 start_codon:yes stop_codon:yes gene_type:complete